MDLVIPAEAGISCLCVQPGCEEMPAFAGMTKGEVGVPPSPLQASLASLLASFAILSPKGARKKGASS